MSTESLAVVATGFSVFALLIAVALAVRLGRLVRAYDALAGDDGRSFVASVARQRTVVRDLRTDVAALGDELARSRGELSGAVRHVAVVRYDAFGDLSGALSFSAALLDGKGDGLVLSSISGRSDSRTYAKGVRSGASDAPLSPEEQEAIATALAPAPVPARPAPGRSRRRAVAAPSPSAASA